MNTVEYSKLLVSIRYWLIGKAENDSRYYLTLDALEYAKTIHTGKRKDGVTEEFYHQLNIVSFLRTLVCYFDEPHIVLAVAILHDTIEDYPHTSSYVQEHMPTVMPYLTRINKVPNGVKLTNDEYYRNMVGCIITVSNKCVDRLHNLSTMIGVFSEEKIQSYITEVHDHFLPMLKDTKRIQPRHEALCELLKSQLLLQVNTIKCCINEFDVKN